MYHNFSYTNFPLWIFLLKTHIIHNTDRREKTMDKQNAKQNHPNWQADCRAKRIMNDCYWVNPKLIGDNFFVRGGGRYQIINNNRVAYYIKQYLYIIKQNFVYVLISNFYKSLLLTVLRIKRNMLIKIPINMLITFHSFTINFILHRQGNLCS